MRNTWQDNYSELLRIRDSTIQRLGQQSRQRISYTKSRFCLRSCVNHTLNYATFVEWNTFPPIESIHLFKKRMN